MARSDPPPSRGRRRTWVTIDGEARPTPATQPAPATQPTPDLGTDAPPPDLRAERSYEPRRRYPWHDDPDYDPAAHRRSPAPPSANWTPPDARESVPWTTAGPPPIDGPPPAEDPAPPEPAAPEPEPDRAAGRPRVPRKLTVTRVAAMRSRQITGNGIRAFRRAAGADGADRSGLTALTYATMMTYAVDAAVSVALANTLFFAAATAESKTNVALYLAITVAPFAVVAPIIGPLLDRLQRGRRVALAVSFGGRAVLAVVMAFNYDTWLLYPAALGVLVLSRSFAVLKAAVTPRVLPPSITLVTTNARLTTFGMIAGGVFGAIAAGFVALTGSFGALLYIAAIAVFGAVMCLRIPAWVESTAGEVPAGLRSTGRGRRRPISRGVAVALWGNSANRMMTGFLTLFAAFVVKEQTENDPGRQLILLGIVGAAAGLGSFSGNAVGSRSKFGHPDAVLLSCAGAAVAVAVLAALIPGIPTAAVVGLVGAFASAIAKVSLDAVIQRDIPEESRASAFGRSETVLQLAWTFGGALGVLLPHDTFWIGFAVIAGVLAVTWVQAALVSRGHSLVPFLNRGQGS